MAPRIPRPAPIPSSTPLRRSTRISKPPSRYTPTITPKTPKKRKTKKTTKPTLQAKKPYEARLVYNMVSHIPGNPCKARFIRDRENRVDPGKKVTQIVVYVTVDMAPVGSFGVSEVMEITLSRFGTWERGLGDDRTDSGGRVEIEKDRIDRILADLVGDDDDFDELDRELDEMVADSDDDDFDELDRELDEMVADSDDEEMDRLLDNQISDDE